MTLRLAAVLAMSAALLGTAGCAGGAATVGGEDGRIIAQLADIAPRDSKVEEPIEAVECWKPSESMIDDDTFRVLCRLHYTQAGAERYRDMICLGSVTKDPVSEYCYLWAFYSDMPVYEDQPGYRAA
ncbi:MULTISPECIES: hypothetical protein [unclassified Leucobacter]|uniref:hypothetical protein n=1 Tax=unclassified Leucobacter TaxID=2621730 RepID=UPI00165DE1ED|nr:MULTISPECIES: hypothetical protein [unclassified Leucobacter]MBC9926208.1 hypothetical protein [Leucobacter sp. cx-169]MBC9935883.1 hypothetical protein [Leucobacter sp. cx-87]